MPEDTGFFLKKLRGPIAILGAGGFVGINLFNRLFRIRKDVLAISSNPEKNWRIKKNRIPPPNVVKCNLIGERSVRALVQRYKPKTIFNLVAYGAYPTQKDIDKIYRTNFNSTYALIEELKKYGFTAYLHAGSQSEYGINSSGPAEVSELIPNSHYAVSKTADYYLLKYYGKVEKLPVIHLRLYSVYGPWEEPSRLVPTLIHFAKKAKLPMFVDPNISRDFVYIDDAVEAFIAVAARLTSNYYGEVFNVASGKKTTIKELAYLAKKLFKIKSEPQFSAMKNRDWDLKDWYGNPKKIRKAFGWKAKTSLQQGLAKFFRLS